MTGVPIPAEFEKLIGRYGRDFSIVQGLGGNCSVKTASRMRVKASGQRMAAVKDSNFFYEVALTASGFRDDVEGQSGKPSIEVYLHALLPFKYVVHLHSTKAIAFSMTSSFDPDTICRAKSNRIYWIPYSRPGLELMDSLRGLDFDPRGFSSILQNHGIVVAANSIKAVANRVREIERFASPEELVVTNSLSPTMPKSRITLELRQHALWHAKWNWRVTPDHVVFLGSTPDAGIIEALNSSSTVAEFVEELSRQGKSITQQEQALWYLSLANMLPREKLHVLSEEEAQYLVSWEAEKLRILKSH